MTDEELIEELCGAVAEISDYAQRQIDYLAARWEAIETRGEEVEDAKEAEQVLSNHRATVACCDRWFKKHGVE